MQKKLKAIMYTSRCTGLISSYNVPVDIVKILRNSIKWNKVNEVSGFVSYKSQRYLQLIEGEENIVDRLYEKIKKDTRHSDILTLLDTPIADRMFPDWDMRLLVNLQEEMHLMYFFRRYLHVFDNSAEALKKALSLFVDLNTLKSKASSSSAVNKLDFKGKAIKLSKWPDFSVIENDSHAIEICARAVGSSCGYDELFQISRLESTDRFDQILAKFDKQGILVVSCNEKGKEKSVYDGKVGLSKSSNRNSFYGLMKEFLKLGK